MTTDTICGVVIPSETGDPPHPTCTQQAGHRGPHAMLADPWATRHADGTITLHWPEGVTHALCSRELIMGMVEHHNQLMPALTEALTRWQADDDHLCDERRPGGHDGPQCERPRINGIRRSVGLAPID